jgi:oligosaccharide repeat unit polymerase
MTRGILMSIVVQLFFVYYYLVGIKYKYLNRLILIFIIVIILFGFLGDLRTTGVESVKFSDLAQPNKNYPQFLPSGFIWVYMYITTPLNNIVNNIDQYPLLQFSAFDAFGTLVPGSIRSSFGKSKDTHFKLVVPYLNVTSSHRTYLAGFGIIGSLLFQSLLGFIVTLFYIKYKNTGDTRNCLIIAILAHNLFLSFFVDFFLMLPYLSEFFFSYIFFTKVTIK